MDVLLQDLLLDQSYTIQIRAKDSNGQVSSWSQAYIFTTVKDETAPSIPSSPIVAVNMQAVQVSHDMTNSLGNDLEIDVEYLEVHAGSTSNFAPDNSTKVGEIFSAGQGIPVSAIFSRPTDDSVSALYWRVIAVDRAKNKSEPSASINAVPGLIDTAYIANLAVTDAKIGEVSAAKLKAGTAIINDLSVQSRLTVNASGYIQSSNFDDVNKTGYSLDEDGLRIHDGLISADALLIQDATNIVHPMFADFDYDAEYYKDLSHYAFSEEYHGLLNFERYNAGKFGLTSFRFWSIGDLTGLPDLTFQMFKDSAVPRDVPVVPGDYIASVWVRTTTGTDAFDIQFGLRVSNPTPASMLCDPVTINSTTWTQVYGVVTIPEGNEFASITFQISPAGSSFDLLLDGLQIERKIGGLNTPSSFKSPGLTSINGAAITTGSIKSSSPSTTVEGEPAWYIDMEGDIQVGDAKVKGTLIVGTDEDGINIMPEAFSDFSEPAEFYHNASHIPNAANFEPYSDTTVKAEIVTSDYQFAPQCLRLYNTTQTAGGARGVHLTNDYMQVAGNNVPVVSGSWYTISAYVKSNNLSIGQKLGFVIWTAVGQPYVGSITVGGDATLTGTWTRIYGFYKPLPGRGDFQLGLYATTVSGTGFDFLIDGVMVERWKGVNAPSTYSTGTAGLSHMASANYATGHAGWYISSHGDAEFNEVNLRGTISTIGASTGIAIKDDVDLAGGGTGSAIDFHAVTGGQLDLESPPLRLMLTSTGTGHLVIGNYDGSPTYTESMAGLFVDEDLGFSLFSQQGDANIANMTKQFIGTDTSNWGIDIIADGTLDLESDSGLSLTEWNSSGGIVNRLVTTSLGWSVYPQLHAANSAGSLRSWTSLTLASSWLNRPGFYSARARINALNQVELAGTIWNGITTSGTKIAALPSSEYYPASETRVPCAFSNGANANLIIKTNGDILLSHAVTAASTLILMGVYPVSGPTITP